jgi:hypothetical protein
LRLTAQDRSVISSRGSSKTSARADHAAYEDHEAPQARREKGSSKKSDKETKPPRRSGRGGGSLLGRLFYWADLWTI